MTKRELVKQKFREITDDVLEGTDRKEAKWVICPLMIGLLGGVAVGHIINNDLAMCVGTLAGAAISMSYTTYHGVKERLSEKEREM